MLKRSLLVWSGIACTVAALFLPGGCSNRGEDRHLTLADARTQAQPMIALGPARRPSARVDLKHAAMFRKPLDKDSVELVAYDGGEHYWPVDLCHRGVEFLNGFRLTGDSTYLRRAVNNAAALDRIAVMIDSTLFSQYLFPYRLHSEIRIAAPWYSGMAQGEWAGFLTRMYEATGDSTYLDKARLVFESLLIIGPRDGAWVARIDSAGYYWIEEFPDRDRPGKTLNGFIAAVFGVYDYYQATGDERARRVYDASLTTLKHYIPDYRRPGARSYYCTGHEVVANKIYHELHTSMMFHLYRMTEDEFFKRMGDSLTADGVAVGDVEPTSGDDH